ncbi:MAG: GDP-mannose 4,6-dehydratase, partial [Sulfurospirillaceae bacterium]|nr:GDP-mannose 4,6-dehydratase [Sulfurospirillaceae bacterium]
RIEIETIVHQVAPDFVIHLAGIAFVAEKNASLIYDVNVIGTGHLLEALAHLPQKPRKVILASSATVYGNQHCDILEESMMPKPVNHYGFSKLSMEHLAATYFEKLPIIITRPFNYTGVGQDEQFLIPKIIKHYKEKKASIELGNLHVAREFNDVHDVVTWYADLLTCSAQGEIVNLCSSKAISLLEIIALMNNLAGYEIKVKINPAFVRENEIKTLFGSSEKLSRMIPYHPTIAINETLKTMYLHEVF